VAGPRRDLGQCGDDRVVDATEVDGEHPVDGFAVHRAHGGGARGDAGVGDHDIDSAAALGHGGDHTLHGSASVTSAARPSA